MALKKFEDLKKFSFFILKKELDEALKPNSNTKPGVYRKEEDTFGETKYWGRKYDGHTGVVPKREDLVIEVDAT